MKLFDDTKTYGPEGGLDPEAKPVLTWETELRQGRNSDVDIGKDIARGVGYTDSAADLAEAKALLFKRKRAEAEDFGQLEKKTYMVKDILQEEAVLELELQEGLELDSVFAILERRWCEENQYKRDDTSRPIGLFDAAAGVLQRRLEVVNERKKSSTAAWLNDHHAREGKQADDRATQVLGVVMRAAFFAEIERIGFRAKLASVARNPRGVTDDSVKGMAAVLEDFRYVAGMFLRMRSCGVLVSGEVEAFGDEIVDGFKQMKGACFRMAVASLLKGEGLGSPPIGHRLTGYQEKPQDCVRYYLYNCLEVASAAACDEALDSVFQDRPGCDKKKKIESFWRRANRELRVFDETYRGRGYGMNVKMWDAKHLAKRYDELIAQEQEEHERLFGKPAEVRASVGLRARLAAGWRSLVGRRSSS